MPHNSWPDQTNGLRQCRDKAIRTEGTRVQDVQTGQNECSSGSKSSLSNLHFHTQSESAVFFIYFFLLVPFSPLLHSLAFFPRFQMNVLLTLFFHLTLRDGLSHLKLNMRPGATLIQPSVRPCSFSPFFPFSLLAIRGEKIVQREKRAVRLTLSSQRGKMHFLKIKSSPDC